MKTCVECGGEFKPIGRQKVCKECKSGVQKGLQEADEKAGAQGPLSRFSRGRMTYPGQNFVRVRR